MYISTNERLQTAAERSIIRRYRAFARRGLPYYTCCRLVAEERAVKGIKPYSTSGIAKLLNRLGISSKNHNDKNI